MIGRQLFIQPPPIDDTVVERDIVNCFDSTLEEVLDDKVMGGWNIGDECMRTVENYIDKFIQVSKRLPVGFKRQFYSEHIVSADDITGELGIAIILKSHTPDFIALKVKEAFGSNIGVFVEQSDC